MIIDVAAKINTSLKITGIKDGMHTIVSTMQSIDLYDTLCVESSDVDMIITDIAVENNTIIKALNAFRNAYGAKCVNVTVKKRIPIGAGLGGSSADAAGMLVALSVFNGIGIDRIIEDGVALKVGSDVPFMIKGGCAVVKDTGNLIESVSEKSDDVYLIAVPNSFVSTRDAYKLYDEVGTYADAVNDLTKAAKLLNEDIVKYEAALNKSKADKVFMSGSGSAMVGVFKDVATASEAARTLDKLSPRYVAVHKPVGSGIRVYG